MLPYFLKKEVELSLFHPWEIDLSKAEQIAIESENTALNFSKKIKNNLKVRQLI